MITKRLLLNIINKLNKSFLLIGPRQVGKSTLIQNLDPEIEINFADQETFLKHSSNPSLIKEITAQYQTIFIDEVQRIPSILNTIQTILDKNKSKKFYLTGSSARKLKRGQANLLPGRILTYELGPLTYQELGKDKFSIEKALKIGLLPGIYHEENIELAQKILRSYAATYLKEEVQAEALTRNIEGFSRFFQVIASRSGQYLDFAKFSSEAMIERTTAKRYFDILVDTLIIYPVEPFAKSKIRRLSQHPKYYFFDTGVLNGCLGNFIVSLDRVGILFEHLFLQLIISHAKSQDKEVKVCNYRTGAGAEVDFIINYNEQIFAIEVKASKQIGKHDLSGLKSFAEFFQKPHTSIIVYLGEDVYSIDDIHILPLKDSLEKILGNFRKF
jgi:predicted AAA+ superfamily ATPase